MVQRKGNCPLPLQPHPQHQQAKPKTNLVVYTEEWTHPGETLKRVLRRLMWSLFNSRFPFKTSDTTLSVPNTSTKSFCLRSFASINSAITSRGVDGRSS